MAEHIPPGLLGPPPPLTPYRERARLSDADDLTWYAVYTVAQQETLADRSLRLRGYDTFCPLERVGRVRRRATRPGQKPQRVWVRLPYYPNYIFVGARPGQSIGHVFGTMGVIELVRSDGVPARIPPGIIAATLARSRKDPADPDDESHGRRLMGEAARSLRPRLTEGTIVETLAGRGEVAIDTGDSLRVWLEMFGTRQLVPVADPDAVEVIAPPPDTKKTAKSGKG